MEEIYGLKPQDVIVLLKLLIKDLAKDQYRHQADLAVDVGISAAEVGNSLARLKGSRLITSENKPIKPSVTELLLYGIKYVYPGTPGAITRGMPTAHSAAPLNQKFKIQASDMYVWPDPQGEVSGQAVKPIYKSVPDASKKDSKLYEMLSLLDALRVGRAREVEVAKEELKLRIRGKA